MGDVIELDVGERLLTSREAAEVLGVHVNTLKRLAAIPFYRVTKRGDRRYRRADVIAYLRSVQRRGIEQ